MTEAPAAVRDLVAVRDLKDLPKAHLHIHHEAAIRPETLAEMGAAEGVDVSVPDHFDDFSDFSQTYRGMLQVLSIKENLFRLIEESIEDCARDGVAYAEFGASPHFYVDTFGSTELALDAMIEKAREYGAKWGVEVGYMITADRVESPDEAVTYAKTVAPYAGRGVVSFGLANDERGHPAAQFEEAFRIAKEAGLLATPHAGELAGPDEILSALDVLGADRILHGATAVQSDELVARLAQDGTCLDLCPTSNLLLGVVPTLEAHPLKTLLDAGVRCSINADDPVLFGPGILEEYQLCRDVLGLSDEELAACALSSIECSGASEVVKQKAVAGIAAWLA
ncbi:adenosine deaminase [Frondihabitans sp. PhB188]|uniref:adenosine deaminase n=1 Tax=Frondihabitans sp. PhB188 TaxID=2485200 RepID=UPI000F49BF91|nr:adenosine deaminase [Frondihabitans sp. PhB188]ROQ38549.1 adenosine deaminase [Frondihabitans sp. PhB188]